MHRFTDGVLEYARLLLDDWVRNYRTWAGSMGLESLSLLMSHRYSVRRMTIHCAAAAWVWWGSPV